MIDAFRLGGILRPTRYGVFRTLMIWFRYLHIARILASA